MYQVEDEPLETIHLYVVREEERERPPIIPLVVSLFALSLLIALGITIPYKQPEIRVSLRVPAVPLYVKTFQASIKIVPTGMKSYPATYAHGVLTFTNGSIIGQSIPAGFVVDNVATDEAVYVPGATANGFGVASIKTHSLHAGVNLAALSINVVIGTSLFIRNLNPFTGGRPAYSVTFATPQDRVRAIDQARALVASQVVGLHYPCRETITMTLIWRCQFVTYSLPSYMHVTSAVLKGHILVVTMWFVAHPRRIWVK